MEKAMESFIKIFNSFVMDQLKAFLSLLDFLLGGTAHGLSLAWENPLIEAFVYTANCFSWAIFVFSFLFFLLKIVQEEKRNWYAICKCPINAILFISLNQLLARACFLIPDALISALNTAFQGFVPSDILLIPMIDPVMVLLTIIALVYFVYVTVLRFGTLFIQVMLAPFYVPFIVTGDNQKASEWILSTAAVCFTYLIQYLLFYAGFVMLFLGTLNPWSNIIALSLMLSVSKVSEQMQKFGWSSGASKTLGAAYTGVNMISTLVRGR